jgi:membrane protease YdiL (CAAX protease family)
MNEPAVSGVLAVMIYAALGASLAVWLAIAGRLRRGGEVVVREPRERVPWGADGSVLVAVMLAAAATSLVAKRVVSEDVNLASPAEPTLLVQALMLGAMYAVMAGGVAGWFHYVWRAHRGDFGLGRAPRGALRDVGLGVAAMLAALAPVFALRMIEFQLVGQPDQHELLDQLVDDPWGSMLGAALIAVVIAPLFEEFAFRVLLQGWLEDVAESPRSWWPLVVSSGLFAIAHQGQGYAQPPLFVLAMFLGYLYRQTHRLLPCFVAHAAFNAFSLAMVAAMPRV